VFTGIVEELGVLSELDRAGQRARLTVRAELVTDGLALGDSVAVSGVCLTVVDFRAGWFTADVMAETLARTSLGRLVPGAAVNLERPLTLASRLGGHLVQGHVDAVGEVLAGQPGDGQLRLTVGLPARLSGYLVAQGSVTVDGVSLTVVEAGSDRFSVSLIPATLSATTLGRVAVGDPVNLEMDVIAKYVARMVGWRPDE
jgi:riboflavin synthase